MHQFGSLKSHQQEEGNWDSIFKDCNLFQMCQMLHIFLAISCELGLEQLALWFRDTWPALLCVLGVWGEKLQYHNEVDCKQILYGCK